MHSEAADYAVFNVGTGRPLSVLQVAGALAACIGFDGDVSVTNTFRAGDIRHCYADIKSISAALNFHPKVAFEAGVDEVAGWVREQSAEDRVQLAHRELIDRRLAI
jgi:dTDP-L-rhamnose 4-epimerase